MTVEDLVAKIETRGPLVITLNYVRMGEYFRDAFIALEGDVLPDKFRDKEVLSFRIINSNEIDVDFLGDT